MHDIITDELEKPLEVDEVRLYPFSHSFLIPNPPSVHQAYLRRFEEMDRKQRAQWLEEARKQEVLLRQARRQIKARKQARAALASERKEGEAGPESPSPAEDSDAKLEQKLKALRKQIRAGKKAALASSKPRQLLESFTGGLRPRRL